MVRCHDPEAAPEQRRKAGRVGPQEVLKGHREGHVVGRLALGAVVPKTRT